jgi:hypothetical protein
MTDLIIKLDIYASHELTRPHIWQNQPVALLGLTPPTLTTGTTPMLLQTRRGWLNELAASLTCAGVSAF